MAMERFFFRRPFGRFDERDACGEGGESGPACRQNCQASQHVYVSISKVHPLKFEFLILY